MQIEKPFFDALIGKTVSEVWRGAGSAIFIEFGNLTQTTMRDGSPGQPNGELTLMIEFSWRISDDKAILAGSFSSETDWSGILRSMVGSSVIAVEIFGELPEILVSLSCGKRAASFMTADGQPEWAIISRQPNLGSLCVNNSELIIESNIP